MQDEVTTTKLRRALGKRVDVQAFGISYVGTLKRVNAKEGLVRIQEGGDYVILEIERIEHFQVLGRR